MRVTGALLPLLLLLSVLPLALSVDIPYTSCASSTAHLNISSVSANVWPPVIDHTFSVNISGTLDKPITAGKWSISIHVGGFPLPSLSGDLSDFHALPWAKGAFTASASHNIPSLAPSGSYKVEMSGEDQDSEQVFCADASFKMSRAEGGGREGRLRLRRIVDQPHAQ